MEIDGHIYIYNMLTNARIFWGGSQIPNELHTLSKFDVIPVTYSGLFCCILPISSCWIFQGVHRVRQEYDSKLASAARALGQLKRSLDKAMSNQVGMRDH